MNVALTPAGPDQEPVFAHLMQLYYYDLSEIVGVDIGDDGRFPFAHHKPYWSDARYRPFLIQVDGHLAGFSVVDAVSRITGAPAWDMSQFFVLRRHRAAGAGARAAVATFDLFRGPWEVRVIDRNEPAQGFWRKVIDRYTGGRFVEERMNDDFWHGPVFRFDTTVAP